jgi:NMD protein affecting ribosome stability and mRNA decay
VTYIEVTTGLETLTCGHEGCGIIFAVPKVWIEERHRDHLTWYCPNGHPRHFPNKSEAEKLRDQLTAERARTDQARAEAQHQLNRVRAAQGQVTKIKNRVANGVCPCCSRSFTDLRRHMESKHPDYRKTEAEAKP